MLLETRNKGAGVERVLDQHKCCRERAKLEFLVTQKEKKKERRRGRNPQAGLPARRAKSAAGGLIQPAGGSPACRRVGLDFF